MIAVGNDKIWASFAPLVGLDATDARFGTNAVRLRQYRPSCSRS